MIAAPSALARQVWLRCILRVGRLSHCGRTIVPVEWSFTSPEHAQRTAEAGSRLVPCPACVAAARRASR